MIEVFANVHLQKTTATPCEFLRSRNRLITSVTHGYLKELVWQVEAQPLVRIEASVKQLSPTVPARRFRQLAVSLSTTIGIQLVQNDGLIQIHPISLIVS